MITLAELNEMSDEDVKHLNAYLGRKVVKKFAIQLAITVVVTAAAIAITNKFANDDYQD